LEFRVDTDIFKVERLGIFVFKASPNCNSVILNRGSFEKVGRLKSCKQSFKSKIMSSLPAFQLTTTFRSFVGILVIVCRGDRREIYTKNKVEAIVDLEGSLSLNNLHAVFPILEGFELDAL
jgi:hypothetical protein